MRMLRSVLTAIVLASAAAACGGGGSGPTVVAGAPAGDVTEVSGTVTATRDGKTRPLAVGDEVSGDDVVETGADGHVAIRLRHNLVPWTLGPGKKETVSASLAWKAPRASQVAAGPTGERSGAAGRHAECEAADTTATAAADEAPMAESAKAAMAEPAPSAQPAPVAAAAPMEAPKMEAPAPPPPPAPIEEKTAVADKKEADTEIGDSFGAGGLGLSGTGEGGGGAGGGIGLGGIGTLGHGSGTGEGYGVGAGKGAAAGPRARKPADTKPIVKVFNASGGLDIAVVARVVRTRNARLTACVDPVAPARAMVRITIKPDGKVDQVQVSGVAKSASDCLEKWMRATSFPSAKTATNAGVIVQGVDPLSDL